MHAFYTGAREPFFSILGSISKIKFYHVTLYVDFHTRHMQRLTSAQNFRGSADPPSLPGTFPSPWFYTGKGDLLWKNSEANRGGVVAPPTPPPLNLPLVTVTLPGSIYDSVFQCRLRDYAGNRSTIAWVRQPSATLGNSRQKPIRHS